MGRSSTDFTCYTGADSGADPAAGAVVGSAFTLPDGFHVFFEAIATVLGTTPSVTLKLQTNLDPAGNAANWVDYPSGAFPAITDATPRAFLLIQNIGASFLRTVVSASSGTGERLNPSALYAHIRGSGA